MATLRNLVIGLFRFDGTLGGPDFSLTSAIALLHLPFVEVCGPEAVQHACAAPIEMDMAVRVKPSWRRRHVRRQPC